MPVIPKINLKTHFTLGLLTKIAQKSIFFGQFLREKILKPPVASRNAQKAPNTEAPQSLAARKVSKKTTKRRKTKVVKSKSKKSIKTAVNEVEYCDIVESCHVKHPRVDMEGNVYLRWFAVVAHVMPVFLYSYLFRRHSA